jgi:hypothetical protein
VLALLVGAVPFMGASGCDNPNGQGVTDRGTISGRVYDAQTQQPIGSATVQVGEQVVRISPAEKGGFVVKNVPAGTQIVVIASPGYQTYTQPGVVVRKDENTDIGLLQLSSATGMP